MNNTILIADDDPIMRKNLFDVLTEEGFEVLLAVNGPDALATVQNQHPPVLLLDINLPVLDGFSVLQEVKKQVPETSVIVFTAYGTSERAIRAMKIGAFDYLEKPFDLDELLLIIRRAITHNDLLNEVRDLRARVSGQKAKIEQDLIVGTSPAMQEIYKTIGKVSQTDTPVLIEGESGTGKELIADAIQRHSLRRDRPFIKINCGALPETLLESEIFGHEKGSFTGAIAQRQGRFELANGGTLFLDEINNMPLTLQMKLLRVLQQKTFERVGGKETLTVDVRILAASNKDLNREIKSGRFRDDLLYRLNVIHLKVPSLRDRLSDLPYLIDHFLQKHGEGKILAVSLPVIEKFQAYGWPGNIRELENVIQHAIVFSNSGIITLEHLPMSIRAGKDILPKELLTQEEIPFKKTIEDVEKRLILRALEQADWNRTKAAEILDIHRRLLFSKMKQYKIKLSKPGESE
ncbi:MAG: sigma-54 dependent transcriptional regulator [bacterium]